MSAARDLVKEAFRTEEHGLEWRAGIAGAVATVGPLAIGIASGEAVLGLIAGIGGLNTSLCIPGAGLRSRLWWGSVAVVSEVAAFALANFVQDYEWAVVVVTLLWVSGWAFARAAGRAGSILGFATAAVFVVLCRHPGEPGAVRRAAALVLTRSDRRPRPDGRRPQWGMSPRSMWCVTRSGRCGKPSPDPTRRSGPTPRGSGSRWRRAPSSTS